MTIIRASLVYLIPVVIGRGVVVLLSTMTSRMNWWQRLQGRFDQLVHRDGNEKIESFGRIPGFFAWGIILIMGWALKVRYLLIPWFGVDWNLWFFGGVWAMVVLGVVASLWDRPKVRIQSLWKPGLAFLVIVGFAIVVQTLWVYKSPYELNWDWYQHQTLSRLIQGGRFEFQSTKMSDTFQFNSYPPTFHLLHAVAQYPSELTPQSMMDFWRWVSFFHLVSVGIVSWLLAYVVVRRHLVGFLGGVFGVLVFDSAYSFTNLFFLPQTLAAVMFTFGFVYLLYAIAKGRVLPWWQSVGLVIALPLMHYTVGVLAMVIYASFEIYSRLGDKKKRVFEIIPVNYLIVLVAMAIVVGSGFVNVDDVNNGEAALYRFSVEEKHGFNRDIYGYGLYLLLPLGVMYAILNRDKNKALDSSLMLLFGFLAIVIADLPYVVKFYTLGRFWVHLFLVLGIWGVMEYAKNRVVRWVCAFAITGVVGFMLVINIIHWKTGLLYDGQYSHISDRDVAVAEFLAQNYGDGEVLIFSDPATQFVLEGLSGVDSVAGAYMQIPERERLQRIVTAENPSTLVDEMRKLEDGIDGLREIKLLIVSGRTFAWAEAEEEDRLSFKYNIWIPKRLAFEDLVWISKMESDALIDKVYMSDSMVVFEISK